MKAKQLIEQTNECVRNYWQNSDLSRRSEIMLRIIAEHFEECEECRDDFDTQEYSSETLIEFEVDDGEVAEYGYFSESGKLSDMKEAGDLIESFREKTFEIVATEE